MSGNPLAFVAESVAELEGALPALLAACTDPEATDMAELLYEVQQARIKLQGIERDVEGACAHAMLGNQALTPTLRVERHRTRDRKQWRHEDWQRDVRQKALRSTGLAGVQGVVNAEGELLDPQVIFDVLAKVQGVHGSAGPKTTALRDLGLDPEDYCESQPGVWHVRVQRIADETDTDDTEGVA